MLFLVVPKRQHMISDDSLEEIIKTLSAQLSVHSSVHKDLHAKCAHLLFAYHSTCFALVNSNLEFMFIPRGFMAEHDVAVALSPCSSEC